MYVYNVEAYASIREPRPVGWSGTCIDIHIFMGAYGSVQKKPHSVVFIYMYIQICICMEAHGSTREPRPLGRLCTCIHIYMYESIQKYKEAALCCACVYVYTNICMEAYESVRKLRCVLGFIYVYVNVYLCGSIGVYMEAATSFVWGMWISVYIYVSIHIDT